MSAISRKILNTGHKGVHEQLDLLLAVMQVTLVSLDHKEIVCIQNMTDKEIIKWRLSRLSCELKAFGRSEGFFQKRLALYSQLALDVYDHYIPIFNALWIDGMGLVEINLIQKNILQEAAIDLDNQFKRRGTADVISYLENKCE